MTFKDPPKGRVQIPPIKLDGTGRVFLRNRLEESFLNKPPPKNTILDTWNRLLADGERFPIREGAWVYRLGRVAVFGGLSGKEEPTGIGRDYDGHRMIWTPERGYEMFGSNPFADESMMIARDPRQTGPDVRKPVMSVDDIQRFKRDVLEAAGRDPAVQAFAEKNRTAMQLDAE